MGNVLDVWASTALWLAGLGVVFALAVRLWPCNPGQARPSLRSLVVDACYWFLIPLLMRAVRLSVMIALVALCVYWMSEESLSDYLHHGYGPAADAPLWVQALLILLVQDVYLYWMHRLLHGEQLWRYHAIHHAPKILDWYSTSRFHPVNQILSFMVADYLVLGIGFSPQALVMLVPFNTAFSALVHANLRWDFGVFRYVIASPVFHRWHHTAPNRGGMKNFAPTFPFLDMLFGTFYMPKGELPADYGIHDEMQENIFSQMLYPFRRQGIAVTNENGDKSPPPLPR